MRDVSLNYKESLSARRAWIEMDTSDVTVKTGLSLSARRAWIEIAKSTPEEAKRWVALRKESVDRNSFYAQNRHLAKSLSARRAWIEIYDGLIASANFWSLSARRAWIEILGR